MRISKLTPFLFGLVLAAAPLAGCDDGGSSTLPDAVTDNGIDDTGGDPGGDPGTDTPETPKAQVRFLHLSPDAPAVDIFAGDAVLAGADDLSFPNGSGYLEVPAGSYDIAIVPAGGTLDQAVLTVPGLALEEGKAYTGVAYDRVASLKALALVDDLSTPMSGKLRVRAIHMAPDVGAVDIWNIPAEGDPAKIYDNVPFGAVGDYLELPAGAYTLGFDVNEDAVPDVVFETPALSQGLIINLFAVQDGADALFLNAQFQDGTTARIDPKSEETPKAQVRFIHLSPDAPSVDIFAGGAALDGADGLAFPNGSGYLEVPAGAYDIAIVPMGGTIGDAVLTVPGLALEEGKAYTGVAYDRLASLKATALVDDLSAPMTGKLRVRAIHMAPDVGAVDIWNIPAEGDPAKVYDNVPFGAVGDYLELPEGAYTLGFDVNEDAVPDVV
ncbi:MAG TPA: DUF4397 domain-containing protein, partial [Myxococcota bacterium]|nr:DUF4397 domain-containing protein [Myxococcota bacterium]